MEALIYGLYCTCHDYEIRYVGQTIQGVKVRLMEHRKKSRKPSSPVARWIRKHGEKNIEMEILEVCTEEDLDAREIFWIAEKRTHRDANRRGLNMTVGGKAGGYSLETRAKLSKSNSGERSWAKLTWEIVHSMRAEYAAGIVTYTDLAKRYGTRVGAISDAIQNRTWVDESYTPPATVTKRAIPKGSMSKLDKAEIAEIRQKWLSKNYYVKELAVEYGRSVSHVRSVVNNEIAYDPEYINTKMQDYSMRADQRAKISASNKGKHKPPSHGERVSIGLRNHHGMAKLDESQAREILTRVRAGESIKSLAKEFDVAPNSISRIKNGVRWAYLQDEVE